jgi:hypothetical protein
MLRRRRKSNGGFPSIIRGVFSRTIAADLVAVQPMNAPTGKLCYLDFPPQKVRNKKKSKTSQQAMTTIEDTNQNNPKYKVGDTFEENHVRGNVWWKIVEVRYGVIEPEYDLTNEPLNTQTMTIGESALDANYHKLK